MSKMNETLDSIKASENFKEKTIGMLTNYNDNGSANSASVRKGKGFKNWSLQKRIIAGSTAAVILLCAILIPVIILTNNSKRNYDGWYVNFSKYASFGAGTVPSSGANLNALSGSETASASRTATVAAAGTQESDKNSLIGITTLGQIEKIVFEKRNSNGEVEKKEVPEMNVNQICSLTKFTFIEFAPEGQHSIPDGYEGGVFISGDGIESYAINNYTGKIYSLSDFHSVFISDRQMWSYGVYYDKNVLDVGDYIYVEAYTRKNNYEVQEAVYKMYVDSNDELVMEEILDSDLGVAWSTLIADKFGNLYFKIFNQTLQTYTKYYIYKAADKTTASINYDIVYKTFNGKVYADSTHFYNENGVLTESAQAVDLTPFNENEMVYSEGNDFYYHRNKTYSADKSIIYKVTKINEDDFTVSTTGLEDYSSTYIALGAKMFFLKTDKVFYVDIKTGKVIGEVKDYIFSSIETDNLGGILFSGRDNKLNNVNGVINPDGEVSILTAPRTVKVYYIKSIN